MTPPVAIVSFPLGRLSDATECVVVVFGLVLWTLGIIAICKLGVQGILDGRSKRAKPKVAKRHGATRWSGILR